MPPKKKPPAEETAAAFLHHVGRGETKEVTAMLARAPALVNAIGPHPFWGGRPQPLHVAIDAARDDMVRLLLCAGADADGSNAGYGHWSPLLVAIIKRRQRARWMLLRAGARVGLVEALAMGDDRRALRLLKRGRAALRLAIPSGGSLLGFARTPKAIDRLLALGVPLDERNQWGTSPIDELSCLGRAGRPLVRHLAARGATVPPEAYARLGDRRSLARLAPAALADPQPSPLRGEGAAQRELARQQSDVHHRMQRGVALPSERRAHEGGPRGGDLPGPRAVAERLRCPSNGSELVREHCLSTARAGPSSRGCIAARSEDPAAAPAVVSR